MAATVCCHSSLLCNRSYDLIVGVLPVKRPQPVATIEQGWQQAFSGAFDASLRMADAEGEEAPEWHGRNWICVGAVGGDLSPPTGSTDLFYDFDPLSGFGFTVG